MADYLQQAAYNFALGDKTPLIDRERDTNRNWGEI